MNGVLTQKIECFSFEEGAFQTDGIVGKNGFVFKVRLSSLPQTNEVLWKRNGFTLSFVRKTREELTATEEKDRVWKFAEDDGKTALLEMHATFVSPYHEPREMVCDLPLALFDLVKKEAYFIYDGVCFRWIYDGETANRDYPFGEPKFYDEQFVSPYLSEYGVAPLKAVREGTREKTGVHDMAFYSPRGYNCWAGDVVNFYKDGVYHLIYFHDRHHHGSRWGGGGHTMCQITTKDFVHWQEHGPFIALDEQWKSVGTGMLLFQGDTYYYTFGFHTSRMIPYAHTGSKLLEKKRTEDTVYGVSYEEIYENGLIPSGANYLYSKDGIHFEEGKFEFHVVENPSVYVNSDGTLTMYGGYGGSGVWKADAIEGPWRKEEGGFDMSASPLKPSTECPSKFELGGYTYLLVGGTGFWMTEKNAAEFFDAAKEGYDIYDGMFVPMVTKTEDGRLIYGGWLRGYGWGSVIVHRELVQGENGRLYMKWLPELEPKTEELEKVQGFSLDERSSYYFEADVAATDKARVVLRFEGERDDALVLDSQKETAQMSGVDKGVDEPEEILPTFEKIKRGWDVPQKPDIYGDFTLGRVDHIKETYKLRVIVHYEKKLDAVTLDIEIGGKRTLVSHRVDKRFTHISWTAKNGEVLNAKLYRVKSETNM